MLPASSGQCSVLVHSNKQGDHLNYGNLHTLFYGQSMSNIAQLYGPPFKGGSPSQT